MTARTSGGTVDLRIFRPGARTVTAAAAATSARAELLPDTVRLRNATKRAFYAYVDVRPDRAHPRSSYTLSVSTRARR